MGRRPVTTLEAREAQICAAAMDLAEKQIREGTASSQVITHYLKLCSSKERLEMERLRQENELLKAKTKAYENEEDKGALYAEALRAFRGYHGDTEPDEY